MKIILFFCVLTVFAACSNGPSTGAMTDSAAKDTGMPGSVIIDTAGAAGVNADTTGMSNAK